MDYEISKVDGEHYVLGVILVPDSVDLQGDTVSEVEISKAIARYNAGSKRVLKNHAVPFSEDEVSVVESYQAPADFFIGGKRVPKGAWCAKFRVSQSIFEAAQRGDVQGFSVGGRAKGE